MNAEDVFNLADKAGLGFVKHADPKDVAKFQRFAALVASAEREYLRESFRVVTAAEASAAILHEREACAKLCEDIGRAEEMQAIGNDYAEAIRARGQA